MGSGWKIAVILALAWRGYGGEGVLKTGVKPSEIEPARLTLNMNDVPLEQALAKISSVSKTQIAIAQNAKKPYPNVTIKVKEEPFWEVIKEIGRQTKFSIDRASNINSAEGYLMRDGSDIWQYPVSDQGWAKVVVVNATRQVSENYASAPGRSSTTSMEMILLVEHGRPVLRYSRAVLEEAMGENGESLAPDQATNSRLVGYTTSLGEIPVFLKSSQSGGMLKSLKGKIFVAVETQSEDWIIENPMDGEKHTHAIVNTGEILTIVNPNGAKNTSRSLSVTLEVPKEADGISLLGKEELSKRIDGFNDKGEAAFEAKNVRAGTSTTAKNSPMTMITSLTMQLLPKGYDPRMPIPNVTLSKVRVRIPAEVKVVEVPFEFKELEMP